MQTIITITAEFNCTLERAFKTPILCDVSKVHTGYGIMPRVTYCTEDEHWGKPGYGKKVFAARSLTQKGGFVSVDTVIERVESEYWKIEVSDFQSWMLGFYKFTGEWRTREVEKDRIAVEYTYTLHANKPLWYPLNRLFGALFWKRYMKKALENVRQLAYRQEPYLYD